MIRSAKRHWASPVVALTLFSVFLCLYGVTLLPDVLPADAGEFQLVARTADVAHPPGYPLYTMLGWVFTHLPIGPTPAWRVNLLSAVTAAAALGLVFSTAEKLTGSILGGVAATLTLSSATTFWATATVASVRPLTAFFTALCFYALVGHAAPIRSQASGDSEHTIYSCRDGYLIIFSLGLSLGLTHHPSLGFPAVVFVLYLVIVDPALLRQPRRWLKPVVAFLVGFLVLTYLPWRGGPELSTLAGFLDHVMARGFRGDMFALNPLDRLVLVPTLFRFQFNGVLLIGMLLGGLFLLWRDRKLALLLIGSFLVHTAVTLAYDAPQTVEYEMPAYVSLALLVAMPFRALGALEADPDRSRLSLRRWGSVSSFILRVWLVVLLIGGAANLLAHLPSYLDLARSRDARQYAETVLSGAPENAIILSNWHWYSPLRYLKQIEGVRPDVAIEYVAPRGEPLERTWVRRIEEHVERRPVVVVRYFKHGYGDLPFTFEPLGEAFLVRETPRTDMPADMTPLDVTLGEQVKLLGYRLERKNARPAEPITMILAWSPVSAPMDDVALFAQLIGPDGELWSAVEDPRHAAGTITSGEVVLDRFTVYPFLHAATGEYTLVIGAYSSRGRLPKPDGSNTVRLDTVDLQPSTTRPVTEHPRLLRSSGSPTLIGVDYDVGLEGQVRAYLHWAGPGRSTDFRLTSKDGDVSTRGSVPPLERGEYATTATDHPGGSTHLALLGEDGTPQRLFLLRGLVVLPPVGPAQRYIPTGDAMVLTGFDPPTGELEPGTETTLRLRFRSQRPLERDYIVSAALTGVTGEGAWAWQATHDTVPALGAIPTLKWIRGSDVLAPHRMVIPPDASAVPVTGSLSVYDHFTQRSLPPLGRRLDPMVSLGTWDLTSE